MNFFGIEISDEDFELALDVARQGGTSEDIAWALGFRDHLNGKK